MSRAVLVTIVVVLILVAGISAAATINLHNNSSASRGTTSTSTSSSIVTVLRVNKTLTSSSGVTFDILILGNITVTCHGCNGKELNNSQFQGFYSYGPNTRHNPIRGNGSATYSYSAFDSPIMCGVSKNTINGTLEVKVYAENSLIFDRNTTSPYGTLSGYWSEG